MTLDSGWVTKKGVPLSAFLMISTSKGTEPNFSTFSRSWWFSPKTWVTSLQLKAKKKYVRNIFSDSKKREVHKLLWQVLGFFFDHIPPFVYTFDLIKVDIFDYLPTSSCKRCLLKNNLKCLNEIELLKYQSNALQHQFWWLLRKAKF